MSSLLPMATFLKRVRLLGSLEEMTSREAKDRQRLRARGIKDRVESVVGSEERYRCAVCKALCYLSHVVCSCSPTHAFCADHVGALCGEESSLEHLSLRLQLSDDDMRKLVTTARERASAADNWRQLYRDLVARTARPPFKALKAMLAKGEQMGCDVPELRTLRRCVDRAGKWIAEASHFLQPQQAGRRRKRRGRTTASAAAPSGRGHKEVSKGLSDLLRLLGEVHDLGFDTPEISALRALANKAASVQERALSIVQRSRGQHNRPEVINEAKALLAHAASVTFPLQEVQAVQKVLHKEELMQSLEDLQGGDYPGLSLQQLRGLLAEARACGLATEHSHLKTLQAKVQEGDDWEQKVQAILHADVRNMADLEFLAKAAGAVPYVEPSVLDDVRALYSRARDYESQAGTWMSADEQAGEDMPTIADVRRFIDKVEQEFKIDAIESLKRAVRTAADLENRCKQVISHNYLPGEEDVFETISQWVTFAKSSLPRVQLPSCRTLEKQLGEHRSWLREIPWHSDGDPTARGSELFKDVMAATLPDDDLAPADERYSCICDAPVLPPAEGETSDAVQCTRCCARFHADCASTVNSCAFCHAPNWNGDVRRARPWHFCYLPRVLWIAPALTKHYSREWRELQIIVSRVDRLAGSVGEFLAHSSQPVNQRAELLPQVRHYMRKLWRIQLTVSPKPDVSFGFDLAGLHRRLAALPEHMPERKRRPTFLFALLQDRSWTDGSRCVCRGRPSCALTRELVLCVRCRRKYHAGCVLFPDGANGSEFVCPPCCVRNGEQYPWADVQVKQPGKPVTIYCAPARWLIGLQTDKSCPQTRSSTSEGRRRCTPMAGVMSAPACHACQRSPWSSPSTFARSCPPNQRAKRRREGRAAVCPRRRYLPSRRTRPRPGAVALNSERLHRVVHPVRLPGRRCPSPCLHRVRKTQGRYHMLLPRAVPRQACAYLPQRPSHANAKNANGILRIILRTGLKGSPPKAACALASCQHHCQLYRSCYSHMAMATTIISKNTRKALEEAVGHLQAALSLKIQPLMGHSAASSP